MIEEETKNPFDLSIGDLMSALLMIFVLLLMYTLLNLEEEKENHEEVIKQFENISENIRKDLKEEFKDDLVRWHATINDTTLTIKFSDDNKKATVFFDNGRSFLKPEFQAILDDFFPRYLTILRKPKYIDEIYEIRIEGHTSSTGIGSANNRYFKNMELSQARSRRTLEHVFSASVQDSIRGWCVSKITANGLSFSKPVLINGKENKKQSRRVEFTVKIDAESKLKEISELLKVKK